MQISKIGEESDEWDISNEQALANILMYCKIIRDFFALVNEAPLFFKQEPIRNQTNQDPEMMVSARFNNVEEAKKSSATKEEIEKVIEQSIDQSAFNQFLQETIDNEMILE